MVMNDNEHSRSSSEANREPSGAVSKAAVPARRDSSAGTVEQSARPDQQPGATSPLPGPGAPEPKSSEVKPPSHRRRKWFLLAGAVAGLAVGGYFLVPWVETALNTVSTDDAYVNGDVTFVAPRVAGQVARVLVKDNNRVRKGDLLVQLDPEPFDVQVNMAKASVAAARADLQATRAQTQGLQRQLGSVYFALQRAIEDVDNQIANLRAAVATLNSRKATLELAKANLKRGEGLAPTGAMSKEDLDQRRQAVKVDEAAVDQAMQQVRAIRVGLGLPAEPPEGKELTDVPPNLDQTFSGVRQAQAGVLQAAAQLGVTQPVEDSPKEMVAKFFRRDVQGDIERIFAKILDDAPAVKQAESKLARAQRGLDEAELNRRYCDMRSEIDGVVTRKNVNPGNHVQVGESLMAIRSLTDIWIDANFKETQLANLRIGQRARCEVDMYGSRREFEGRITGFTMGTGQTLALLPPQNATGNFVKIVQRLPVRIELTDYDPDKAPLFVGVSVTPYVYYKEAPSGPHAGEVLQPMATLPTGPAAPKP
jgi:membrane fusion protein, multidrug efflux system